MQLRAHRNGILQEFGELPGTSPLYDYNWVRLLVFSQLYGIRNKLSSLSSVMTPCYDDYFFIAVFFLINLPSSRLQCSGPSTLKLQCQTGAIEMSKYLHACSYLIIRLAMHAA